MWNILRMHAKASDSSVYADAVLSAKQAWAAKHAYHTLPNLQS